MDDSIPFSEHLNGAIQELNTELSDAPGFIHHPAPEMVAQSDEFYSTQFWPPWTKALKKKPV